MTQSSTNTTLPSLSSLTSLPSLPFKFDVSRLKAKIDEVEAVTKKTFTAAADALGVGVTTTKKPKKTQYYMELIDSTKPSLTEEEFLKITPEGFFQENFDTVQFILDMLPPTNSSSEFSVFLDKNVNQFSRSMDYVNSKLYNRVRKNYTEFVQGMSQIHEIGVELQRSTVMCSNGRRTLAQTKRNLTTTAFVIMSKYSKRNLLQHMYVDLSQIKDIVTLERLLKQTLSDGDYPATIKLYLECRNTITQHMHYRCVPELDSNLKQIYNVVQERIDKDFFNSCREFNSTTYQRVFQAYKLLGRADRILEKLQDYFVDPIEPETRNIVYAHVLLSEENAINPEKFKGLSFKDLCGELKDDHFVNCLLAVFEYLCDVMTSLYLMNQFHLDNDIQEESKIFADINSALTRFKNTIWDTMQRQVSQLLEPRKLSNFKIDDFLLVLNSVTKISEIGEEFSGTPSHNLRKSIDNQSKSYFETLHRKRIEDLRTMLENEPWNNIPVGPDFDVRAELRIQNKGKAKIERLHGDQLFYSIKDKGNPFSELISYKKNKLPSNQSSPNLSSINNSSTSNSNSNSGKSKSKIKSDTEDSDEENEELKQEFIHEDEDDMEAHKKKLKAKQQRIQKQQEEEQKQQEDNMILVSSTTISFVRYIGKYLEIMEMLPHISVDIFNSICQMVEYYMYTIYSFSGYFDPQGFSLEALTSKMEKTISEKSFEDLSFTKPQVSKFIDKMKERVGLPPSTLSSFSTANTVMSGITNISPISSITNQFSQFNLTIKNIASNINSPSLSGQSSQSSQQQLQQQQQQQQYQQQIHNNNNINSTNNNVENGGVKWIPSKINYTGLQLGDPKQFFNLPVRMVAIESLAFISQALIVCKSVFDAILPANQTDNINDFYKNVIDIIPDLQKHLIKCVISAFFTYQAGPQFFSYTISNLKWDFKTMATTKSSYVEAFSKEFQQFIKKLDECIQKSTQVYVTPVINRPLRNKIVSLSFEYFIQQLVDGYSKIKKCTNEGRATMIQDLMSIQNSLEKISGGIKIPNVSYAENFIKAFYQLTAFSEPDILEWAKEHDEYPIRYVIGLLQLAKINKPQFFQQLEDMDRRRRGTRVV
ncbi:hypothetical protein CYY_001575 [Polysphondylium violaceum]|uniref:Uncharacterized protein n=1 Tax=Polysphondylium violaceum TaxID=133409 RepID=A0A8J4V414_9MYCE|nr:hypothetical protein CYY_001575 [Polysphondylium violaceum]